MVGRLKTFKIINWICDLFKPLFGLRKYRVQKRSLILKRRFESTKKEEKMRQPLKKINFYFVRPTRDESMLRSLWKVVLASFVSCGSRCLSVCSWACSVIITIYHLPCTVNHLPCAPQVSYGAKVNCMFALRLSVGSPSDEIQSPLDSWALTVGYTDIP